MPRSRPSGDGSYHVHYKTQRLTFRIRTGERRIASGRVGYAPPLQLYQGKNETARDFRKRCQELAAEVVSGSYKKIPNWTLQKYLEYWQQNREPVTPKTAKETAAEIRRYITPNLGPAKLAELTPAIIQAMYTRMRDNGYSADAVHRAHKIMRQSFAQALRWQFIARNPMDGVIPPKVRRAESEHLTVDEWRRFVEYGLHFPRFALFYTIVATSARPAEILGLRPQDLHFEHNSFVEIKGTKTARANRLVYITPRTAVILRNQLAANPPNARFVFCSGAGGSLKSNPHRLNMELRAILDAAGIKKHLTMYGLRHTGVNLSAHVGMPSKARHERQGHADGSSEAPYLHRDESLQLQYVGLLADVV